jgi:hypothetical protein
MTVKPVPPPPVAPRAPDTRTMKDAVPPPSKKK